jgi:short-subunit dehydrogenase
MTDKKIAWVTGASTGIGAATALRLAKDGWIVAATARSANTLRDMAASAARFSGSIKPYPGDVTDAAAMRSVVDAVESELGPVSLAVLNAGTYLPDTLENFTADNLKAQFNINVFGTANCLEPVLNRYKSRNRGHVAIVASVAGYRGLPRSISYGATKAALINMTEALAAECEGTGIKVQIVNPGFIKTPLTDKNDFHMPMLMDVDVAADRLVRGLESARFEIAFPIAFSLITRMFGMFVPDRLYIKAVSKMKPKKHDRKDNDSTPDSPTPA